MNQALIGYHPKEIQAYVVQATVIDDPLGTRQSGETVRAPVDSILWSTRDQSRVGGISLALIDGSVVTVEYHTMELDYLSTNDRSQG